MSVIVSSSMDKPVFESNRAKIRMLHPFQGWCVDGRGYHKHFGLFELATALKEMKKFNNQSTKIYCPHCDREMIHKGYHMVEVDGLEVFACGCGKVSWWNFDMPTPVLVQSYFENELDKNTVGFLKLASKI